MRNPRKEYIKANPLLSVWEHMKSRCYNTNAPAYKNYGARGIKVCDKWQHYRGFLEDMESSYKKGLFLERIDNNGDYEPSNCKWATRKEQNNNTRRNTFITIRGITKTLQQWIDLSGLKTTTVIQRYYHYGWSIVDSLSKPLQIVRTK